MYKSGKNWIVAPLVFLGLVVGVNINNANVSARSESQYLRPYRINTNNIAYNGYNWNQNKYLNPIAFDHFRLTTAEEGSTDYTTSTIYQNPGWKIETSSLPEGD